MTRRTEPREADTQRLILDWLAAKGILAFRHNTGMTLSSYKGRTRAIRYGIAGMADIQAFRQSCYKCGASEKYCADFDKLSAYSEPVWIEVKGAKGKQSEEQRAFQALVESYGHKYILARRLEDVTNISW